MKGEEIEKSVNDIDKRLSVMEGTFSDLVSTLKDNTKAVNELAAQFAVYAFRHDKIELDIRDIEKKQDNHSEMIAGMKPTVESMRGIAWKIVGAALMSGGGVATAILAFISK